MNEVGILVVNMRVMDISEILWLTIWGSALGKITIYLRRNPKIDGICQQNCEGDHLVTFHRKSKFLTTIPLSRLKN